MARNIAEGSEVCWHHSLAYVPPSSLVRVSVPLSDLDRAFWKSPGYRIGGGELEAVGNVQKRPTKTRIASVAFGIPSQKKMHAESGNDLVQEKMQNIKRP